MTVKKNQKYETRARSEHPKRLLVVNKVRKTDGMAEATLFDVNTKQAVKQVEVRVDRLVAQKDYKLVA